MTLTYLSASREWSGPVSLCHESFCLASVAEPSRVTFAGGRLVGGRTRAALLAIAPELKLTGSDFHLATDPTRLTGPAKLRLGAGIVDVDGASAFAFPTPGDQYRVDAQEIPGLPQELYRASFTAPTIAMSGRVSVIAPIVNRIGLGNAHLVYSFPSYASFGGDTSADFAGVLRLSGRVSGELNAQRGQFNLVGKIHACVADLICGTATGVLSNEGAGGCVNVDVGVGDVNIGGGIRFKPYEVVLWPLDGCRWSRFKATVQAFCNAMCPAGAAR